LSFNGDLYLMSDPKPMRKGEQTRAAILNAAVGLAAQQGLEGITIGTLADLMQMSKSGVFAHFGSREDLQIAVLKEYERRFVDDVLRPSLTAGRGLPRLVAIFEHWLDNTVVQATHGCIWISGATEYDDRPGPVRDALVAIVKAWQREISKAIRQAIDEGHLVAGVDLNEMISDLVFDLYSVILALHHDARLLNTPDAVARSRRSFDRLINALSTTPKLFQPTSVLKTSILQQ
jgi:AcrR family transcriptional regulator